MERAHCYCLAMPRALSQGTELRPGIRRHHRGRPREGRVAAVYPCEDILAPHQLSIARNTPGDELRVLDEVGCRVDHTRDDAFPVGQLHLLEDGPFVLVTGIGALEAYRPGRAFNTGSIISRRGMSWW